MPTLRVMTAKEEDPRDEKGGTAGFGNRTALPPSSGTTPQWSTGSGEDREAKPPLLDFDLEPLLELGPEVNCFLQ